MRRAYKAGAAAAAPTATQATSAGFPTEGDTAKGIPATVPGPYWFHMATEAIVTVIEQAGLAPSDDAEQFRDAVLALLAERAHLTAGALFTGRTRGLTRDDGDDGLDFATTAFVKRAIDGIGLPDAVSLATPAEHLQAAPPGDEAATPAGVLGMLRALIPSGTRMVFYQAAAPAGWTKVTTVDDRVLRVVSGQGGATGGAWNISGLTVQGHELTVQQVPAHRHGSGTLAASAGGSHSHSYTSYNSSGNNEGIGAAGGAVNTQTGNSGSHNHAISGSTAEAGGGEAHSHDIQSDGSWRPSYINVIICSKD